MPFKWVNFLFSRIFLFVFLVPQSSWALTIYAESPYSIDATSRDVYYTGYNSTTSLTGGFIDTTFGFHDYNLKISSFTDIADGTYDDLIFFDIQTTKKLSASNNTLAVSVYARANDGEDFTVIPVAAAQVFTVITDTHSVATCSDANRNCQGILGVGGFTYFRAARFTQGYTLRIGISPKDICHFTNNAGTSGIQIADGCSGDNVGDVTSATTQTFRLEFILNEVPSNSSEDSEVVARGSSGADVGSVDVIFQRDNPDLTCPTDFSNFYVPMNEAILMAIASTFTNSFFNNNGGAPVHGLVVVGETPAASLNTGNSIAAMESNSINQRFALIDNAVLSGLQNTTNGSDNGYGFGFSIRNSAGVIDNFSGCTLGTGANALRVSAINQFLGSGNCFIATAAFGSKDAAPVRMLRRFRDEVLLNSDFGTKLVELYYTYSPRAARWLVKNPVYKIPVLILLAPIEVLAWLMLHPLFALIGLMGTTVISIVGISRRSATAKAGRA